jgi:hypothetical protein
MHIEINIFPDSMPLEPALFSGELTDLMVRINEILHQATITKDQAALGPTTLLALDGTRNEGIILATVDIRRS